MANAWPTVHLVGTTQHPGVWSRSPWNPKASKASTPLYLNILTEITTDLASVCAVPISKYERSGEKRHAPSSKRAALILVKIRPSGRFLRDLRPHPRLRDDSGNGCRRSGANEPADTMAETVHSQVILRTDATTTCRCHLSASFKTDSRPVRCSATHQERMP